MRSEAFHFDFPNSIECFSICANDFASNLVGIVTQKDVILGQLKLQSEDAELFIWENLKTFVHEHKSIAICFAPETSLVSFPKTVTFCVAGGRTFHIYRTDLEKSDTVQTIDGHADYINAVAWQHHGEYLATASDDYTCKVRSAESYYDNVITFCLSSAGMAVMWHPEEPQRLLVAEKKGIIRMYNVRAQQAITCVETPKSPLTSADWSITNHNYVSALAGDLVTWDIRYSCSPRNVKQINDRGGHVVRYSPHSDMVMAVVESPHATLKVFSLKSNLLLMEAPLKLFGGLAWHSRYSYIAAASDQKLLFWRIQSK